MELHLLHLFNKLCICIVTCSPTFKPTHYTPVSSHKSKPLRTGTASDLIALGYLLRDAQVVFRTDLYHGSVKP